MVNNRDFNDLITQVNKKFAQLDAELVRLKKELEDMVNSKPQKKIDK